VGAHDVSAETSQLSTAFAFDSAVMIGLGRAGQALSVPGI
jgi:hypothetical protein